MVLVIYFVLYDGDFPVGKLDWPLQDVLNNLETRQLRRSLQPFFLSTSAENVYSGEQTLINFSSNNYLGLARHPKLIERACQWADSYGVGATASRLVCGTLTLHESVETKLASFKKTEAALLLNSGFQANSVIIPSLLESSLLKAEPLVLVDRLAHASLYHGCAAAGVRPLRFRHNDLDHLEFLLKKRSKAGQQPFILTESVFSVDGDRADLASLAALADSFGAVLYVDEAHATGLFGPGGAGLVAAEARGRVDVIVGTFSKALGGFGAYVAGSQKLRQYLINRCSGFIYSTALPPPILGAMEAALEIVPSLTGERARVLATAARLRKAMIAAGLDIASSSTQIVPVILGTEAATLTASRILAKEYGLLATALRPPTVPVGSSRIRFTMSATHSATSVNCLIAAIPAIATLSAYSVA